MDIKNYNVGDESKILELFEIVFKQKLNLINWKWRFRDNPAGKHFIKLMWDNGNLVGHYAVSPLYMIVEGQEVLTALSLTTMTHPDYQGNGVFSELSLALYDELEQSHKCKAIWGFPNNNSHYAFINKLGWKNLIVQHTLVLRVKYLKLKHSKFSCESIHNFRNDHVQFIKKKLSETSSIYVNYTQKYLNWRFIKKPNSNYKCYEFKSEFGMSIIIVKLYKINNSLKFILNIISCFMENYLLIHDYLNYIINDIGKNIEKVTIWKSFWDPDHLSLEKQSFVPDSPQTYVASRIHKTMPDSFSDFRNWNISMSNSDVF